MMTTEEIQKIAQTLKAILDKSAGTLKFIFPDGTDKEFHVGDQIGDTWESIEIDGVLFDWNLWDDPTEFSMDDEERYKEFFQLSIYALYKEEGSERYLQDTNTFASIDLSVIGEYPHEVALPNDKLNDICETLSIANNHREALSTRTSIEIFDNRGLESNCDTLRNIVAWINNRDEHRNQGKSISHIIEEWFYYQASFDEK